MIVNSLYKEEVGFHQIENTTVHVQLKPEVNIKFVT